MMKLTKEIMYQAIVARDTSFEGQFITAVKTTGIFCRPSCTARKPKIENVTFYKTTKEAIAAGYRPCKVCKPLELLDETPQYIKDLLKELDENPALKLKERDIIERHIDPIALRRWFMKNHGISFQAYQRMDRINNAFKKLQKGGSVSEAAYDAGFESISGFSDSFKTIFGVSPSKAKTQKIIDLKRIETPLGTMFVCAVEEGICLLEFSDRRMLETQFKLLTQQHNATIVQGHNRHFDLLEEQIRAYFSGSRTTFDVPLYPIGTSFQKKVWAGLLNIPYGASRSYKEQAIAINQPNAVRAIANANGMNKISIIIPCHRVIGSDGALTGYGGGLWRKQYLLDLEKPK